MELYRKPRNTKKDRKRGEGIWEKGNGMIRKMEGKKRDMCVSKLILGNKRTLNSINNKKDELYIKPENGVNSI